MTTFHPLIRMGCSHISRQSTSGLIFVYHSTVNLTQMIGIYRPYGPEWGATWTYTSESNGPREGDTSPYRFYFVAVNIIGHRFKSASICLDFCKWYSIGLHLSPQSVKMARGSQATRVVATELPNDVGLDEGSPVELVKGSGGGNPVGYGYVGPEGGRGCQISGAP